MFEEKLMAEEGLKKTDNKLIHTGCPILFDENEFLDNLKELMMAAYSNKKNISSRVAAMVSTYHPDNVAVTVVRNNRYETLEERVLVAVGEDL